MDSRDHFQPCLGTASDGDELLKLATMRMPFGKYRGRRLIDLPEPYLIWFAQQGFPSGNLGKMLQTVHIVKVNGLEYLFTPLHGRQQEP